MATTKIALINPESKRSVNYYPTGLCSLSAYIKKYSKKDLVIKIFNYDEDELSILESFAPDIIGLTSFTHYFKKSVQISKLLKQKFPRSLLVFGGCHISVMPESLEGDFDLAVIGEGEQTFLEIVDNYSDISDLSFKSIDGVSYRENGSIIINKRRALIRNLDEIPIPDRDNINDLERIITSDHPGWFGRTGLRYAQLSTSRGCPYNCIFCQPSAMWEKYRMNSPEYIAEEIEYIHRKFGINAVLIEDDLFTGSKKRVSGIIDILGHKGLLGKIIYYVAGRTLQIDDEWAQIFKNMGVYKVEFGIESGSDRVAQYLKTGKSSTEINKKAISILNSHGVSVMGSFIAGAPTETKDELRQSKDMIKWIQKNHKNNTCGIGIATPLPATELWNFAVSKGFIDLDNIDWDKLSTLKVKPKSGDDFILLNENMSADYILKQVNSINFRLNLGTPASFIKALPRRLLKLFRKILIRLKLIN
jgi:anaerobic magnesium-protoporphyrin IX monomethyl ester cyclase